MDGKENNTSIVGNTHATTFINTQPNMPQKNKQLNITTTSHNTCHSLPLITLRQPACQPASQSTHYICNTINSSPPT
ncbi:hypothetical protein E2C01_046581 [Portunus trituberculatus]|uniref:Uncharacterized protein n=1 Tax=Portunus trituberculatus TaxID=210409 RepID=A0A5B7G5G5_PORTR|nr:hypothetical protein [Portunus trituberculatus]